MLYKNAWCCVDNFQCLDQPDRYHAWFENFNSFQGYKLRNLLRASQVHILLICGRVLEERPNAPPRGGCHRPEVPTQGGLENKLLEIKANSCCLHSMASMMCERVCVCVTEMEREER